LTVFLALLEATVSRERLPSLAPLAIIALKELVSLNSTHALLVTTALQRARLISRTAFTVESVNTVLPREGLPLESSALLEPTTTYRLVLPFVKFVLQETIVLLQNPQLDS